MIWFFDSWIGWLTVLQAFQKRFPDFSYLYYGDHENCPYGNKSNEEIRRLTTIWVQKLYDAWATVVIMACNTAIAHTIRPLQQSLPEGKKILWVTVAGAEAIYDLWLQSVAVVATESTVNERAYTHRLGILSDSIRVNEYAAPELAWMIEGNMGNPDLDEHVRGICHNIEAEWLILWCTHYSFIQEIFEKHFPWKIIDPSYEAARKFETYLERNQEWHERIEKGGGTKFLSEHPIYSKFR